MRCQLSNFRQLKLASGEELIAEILEWAGDDDPTIIIRSALKIVCSENADGFRYYSMRPWMVYCEDMKQLLTINSDTVIGETTPSDVLMKQYAVTVSEYVKSFKEQELERGDSDTQSTLQQMFNLADDSDGNIIKLFGNHVSRRNMH